MIKLHSSHAGFAMLTAVIFFLVISSTIVLGIATPILKQVKIAQDTVRSKESFYLAEGALEDAFYRVQTNKSLVSGDTVVVNGYTTTIALTTTSNGRIIETTANRGGIVRKMQAQLITGEGASFNYGIQAGVGGYVMSGGARINGNVQANGSILATGSVNITGSAIAANSAALNADQTNDSPSTIATCTTSNCISFRNVTASQDIAQSFTVSTSSPLNKIQLYIKKVGTPSDATVRIVTDSSGSPSTSNMLTSNGTLAASQVTTSFGWAEVSFPSNPVLDPTQTYWLVLDNSTQNASNYYSIGANSSYGSGKEAKIGRYGTSWTTTTPSGLDIYFKMYLGGLNSVIGGDTYAGGVTIGGEAWANTVQGASVTGALYCQTGTYNNKTCNTSKPDPSPSTFPISDANIADWKEQSIDVGTGWTYSGNLTIGSAGTTTTTLKRVTGNLLINGGGTADLTGVIVDGSVTVTSGGTLKAGPMKVGGNFTIGSTGHVIKGTTWVVGNITVSSGASVSLASTYGSSSGVVVTDGYIDLDGGGNFAGSGTTGSFPLLVTTSICPAASYCGTHNAVDLGGGAGAVVLNAQWGTLSMTGGGGAKSLVAEKIVINGGATVTYETGLADMSFTSGPSGGWNISSWKEIQ
ncbi:MAG: choice-of-anchor R domain-containing protein [Patescibacteria group bacterium]